MSRRFFIDEKIQGEDAVIRGPELQHLAKVLRAKAGDQICLFDGSGAEFQAQIREISRNAARVTILERQEVDRELPFCLTLAVALPKGDRQRWLVEKSVELGVTRLVPLETRRGVAQPVEQALARLSRSVVEATKQCGRNRLMEITSPCTVDRLFADSTSTAIRLVAHPDQRAVPLANVPTPALGGEIIVAIGPEGGFTDEEVAALTRSGQIVSLGARILRIETAALAIAAWFSSAEPNS